MTHAQFTMLIGNIFVATAFITDKLGPILLAILWIAFSWFIIWKDKQ